MTHVTFNATLFIQHLLQPRFPDPRKKPWGGPCPCGVNPPKDGRLGEGFHFNSSLWKHTGSKTHIWQNNDLTSPDKSWPLLLSPDQWRRRKKKKKKNYDNLFMSIFMTNLCKYPSGSHTWKDAVERSGDVSSLFINGNLELARGQGPLWSVCVQILSFFMNKIAIDGNSNFEWGSVQWPYKPE